MQMRKVASPAQRAREEESSETTYSSDEEHDVIMPEMKFGGMGGIGSL